MERKSATSARFNFTEALIRQQASAESFRRGRQYYRAQTVGSLLQRGNTIHGEVAGSQFSPYYIRLFADADVIAGATCTCAYDWGGWCKHIVAVLLTCIHEPEKIEERPTLEDLLSGLDRVQIQTLLLKLAERDLFSVDLIDKELSTLQDDSLRSFQGKWLIPYLTGRWWTRNPYALESASFFIAWITCRNRMRTGTSARW